MCVYDEDVDVLSEELSQARARGAVFSILDRRAPWGLGFSGGRALTAHVLLRGAGLIEVPGIPALDLAAGDVVLVTAGTPYTLVSAPGVPVEPIGEARMRGSDEPAVHDARILCGAYRMEGGLSEAFLATLPRVVVLRSGELEPAHRVLVEVMATEADSGEDGRQSILDRILDLILVYSLRTWWGRPDSQCPGWYRGLADPLLAPALRAIHRDPGAAHTVDALAGIVGLSRAAFAARFRTMVGEPPGRYLTVLRMRRAADALTRGEASLATIAAGVGYANEYAFSTAFRRIYGVSPGRWRRRRVTEAD